MFGTPVGVVSYRMEQPYKFELRVFAFLFIIQPSDMLFIYDF